jgi:glucokinase
VQRFDSKAAPTFQDLARMFLKEAGASGAEAACFGVPGPVNRGVVKATNLPWTLSEEELKRELGIQKIRLVNDLVAYTAAIPFFSRADLLVLHEGSAERSKSLSCVLAPGTGLGMAFLHTLNGVPHPLPSEGGHANFAPNSDLEIELLKYLKKEFPTSVSCERLLCGPGLHNIYRFLRDTGVQKESPLAHERMEKENPAAVISSLALDRSDPLCEQALDLFVAILGAHASNLVLTFLATGGVYLGGGIPPKITAKLTDGTFMRAFLNKEKLVEVVRQTPVFVIKDDKAALLGAAVLANRLR